MTSNELSLILLSMGIIYDILTLDQVCDYLKVSRNTLDGFIKNEGLPIIDLGERNPRVKFAHLQEWLDKKSITKGVKCKTCNNRIDEAVDFQNEESKKEFKISGMCQVCQDKTFKEEDY